MTRKTLATVAFQFAAVFVLMALGVALCRAAELDYYTRDSGARYSCRAADGTVISENHTQPNTATFNCLKAAAASCGSEYQVWYGQTLEYRMAYTSCAAPEPAPEPEPEPEPAPEPPSVASCSFVHEGPPQGMLASLPVHGRYRSDGVAEMAYEFADALLKAREGKSDE